MQYFDEISRDWKHKDVLVHDEIFACEAILLCEPKQGIDQPKYRTDRWRWVQSDQHQTAV